MLRFLKAALVGSLCQVNALTLRRMNGGGLIWDRRKENVSKAYLVHPQEKLARQATQWTKESAMAWRPKEASLRFELVEPPAPDPQATQAAQANRYPVAIVTEDIADQPDSPQYSAKSTTRFRGRGLEGAEERLRKMFPSVSEFKSDHKDPAAAPERRGRAAAACRGWRRFWRNILRPFRKCAGQAA